MTVSIPTTGGVVVNHHTQQITMRDQFAMAALTGILMNDNLLPANNEQVPYRASGMAYELADAMLEARKVKKDD